MPFRLFHFITVFALLAPMVFGLDPDPAFFENIKAKRSKVVEEAVEKLTADKIQDLIDNGVPHGAESDKTGSKQRPLFQDNPLSPAFEAPNHR